MVSPAGTARLLHINRIQDFKSIVRILDIRRLISLSFPATAKAQKDEISLLKVTIDNLDELLDER